MLQPAVPRFGCGTHEQRKLSTERQNGALGAQGWLEQRQSRPPAQLALQRPRADVSVTLRTGVRHVTMFTYLRDVEIGDSGVQRAIEAFVMCGLD